MSKKLAIRGHLMRGKEVIELLEMLGGKNVEGFIGTASDELYTIEDGCIIQAYDWNNCVCFTLEEFLEKYPYKVGDKVIIHNCSYLQLIMGMKWDDTIKYLISDDNNIMWWFTAEELNDFNSIKEATEFSQLGKTVAVCFNKENYETEVELQLGDYMIEVRNGKTYAVLKKPKYPKTYEECYDEYNTELHFIYVDKNERNLYESFIQLIRCRNAYWKIAGEELELGKNWEPDWNDTSKGKHCIFWDLGEITCDELHRRKALLTFPTAEMRDAFYENFKELVEQCNELL